MLLLSPYLLTMLAAHRLQQGNWRETLVIVRRLLVLGEAYGDQAIEEFAGELAAKILQEYRFSTEVLGAIQTALPPEKWQFIYRSLLIAYGLAGDRGSYERVQNDALKGNRNRRPLLRKEEKEFLDLITYRKLGEFRKLLDRMREQRRIAGAQIKWLSQLMTRSFDLKEDERRSLLPFFQPIADYCEAMLQKGGDQKQLEELVHFFGRERESAWLKGSRTARSGAQFTGVTDLRAFQSLPNPYVWYFPSSGWAARADKLERQKTRITKKRI